MITNITSINGTSTVTCKCLCGKETVVKMQESQLQAWRSGVLIQRAAPDLSENDREALISGVCESCWAELYDN